MSSENVITILGVVITIVYAILLLVGGIIGYKKSNSKISLIAASSFFIYFIASCLIVILQAIVGFVFILIGSIILIGLFSFRFYKSRKPMPAIPVLVFSVIVLLTSIVAMIWGNREGYVWTSDDSTY